MTHICQSTYKDLEAIEIENENLRALFLLSQGCKLASLVCKKTDREILVQSDGKKYRKMAYSGKYTDAECSGFDDMFPTIDEWTYLNHPWKGAVMPDHGEVCGLPWNSEIVESGSCLHGWVYGVRFPYRLDKWIRLSSGSELTIKYEATNLSPFDMDFIWAGHIMIAAEPGAQIVLPYNDGAVGICVFSANENFAKPGDILHWPVHWSANSEMVDISRTQIFSTNGNTYKYYFKEKMPQGRCGYAYTDGTTLIINTSKETVPYLGIWINEGAFKGYQNIALEPCTGTFDNPCHAIEHGQNSILPGNGKYCWQVQIEIM